MKRLDNIQETLANINIEWTTSDYFIMPNIPLPEYPEGKDLHFGYYVLFICVTGNFEIYINDVPTAIHPFCLYALTPETIVKPKIKSDDCVLRVLLFTNDFLLKNNFKSDALDDFKFFADSKYNKINLNPDEVSSLLQLYDLLNVKHEHNQTGFDGTKTTLNLKTPHRDILDLLSYWNFYS
ncbi:MAG: hypothetical protein IPH16_01500 [Haliscomenobacter sp.]|nr:hypothetical protein [Haliscomenobacter sp.]